MLSLLAGVAFGLTNNADYYARNKSWVGAQNTSLDPIYRFMAEIEGVIGGEKGTGALWYVDSSAGGQATGKSLEHASVTLDAAIVICKADGGANRGDIIYVAQGHAETLDNGTTLAIDADVAGLTIIGLGSGLDAPEFTYDTNTDEFVIKADGITLFNLRFLSTVSECVNAIEIAATGDNAKILNCYFPEPASAANEFNVAIQLVTAGNYPTIAGCTAYSADQAGAESFIDGGAGAVIGATIVDNFIYGSYDAAAIFSDTADLETYIARNVISNLETDDLSIEYTGNATGIVAYNLMYNTAEAYSLDPGTMKCFENYVTTANDVSGMLIPVHDDGLAQLNATTLTSIGSTVSALTGWGMLAVCEANNGAGEAVTSVAMAGYGNDYFNTGWSMVCVQDAAGAAPEGEIRDIEDYTSVGGVFVVDDDFSVELTTADEILIIRTVFLNVHDAASVGSSGNIWYCDDGGSGGDGTTWHTASITLKAAEALMAAGDICYVGASHSEHISAADAVILNLAGTQFIGMGEGTTRPTFIMEDTAGEITFSAAGIIFKNMQVEPDATVTASGLRIEATGIGCTIENVAFIDGSDSGDEFVDCISVDTLAANLTVKNCTYENSNATDAHTNSFVNLDEATIANCSIIECTVFGNFNEAPIWSDAIPTNVLLQDNVITNTKSGKLCIEFQDAATGMCVGNKLSGDTLGSILDPGSMKCYGNTQTFAIDEGGSPVPDIPQKVDSIHGTGQVFYVDASGSNGGGRTWATAKTTIAAAEALCTADRGDFIYVAQGHAETFTSEELDLDVGGVTVIGIGSGSAKPTITYDHEDGTISVDADNITIKNLRLVSSVTGVKIGITVKLNADFCLISDCDFTDAGDQVGTDEFLDAINFVDTNIGCTVENCTFTAKASGAETAIIADDVGDQLTIRNNLIRGDYSIGCLVADTAASTNLLVIDNVLINGSLVADSGLNAVEVINFMQDCAGLVARNLIACDVGTGILMHIGDDMMFMNNYITDDDGDEYDGGDANTSATIAGHTDG
jgi:hypothetical protein